MIIEDFIGMFPETFTSDECKKYIDYFNKLDELDIAWDRPEASHVKKDKAVGVLKIQHEQSHIKEVDARYIINPILQKLMENYKLYVQKYSILNNFGKHAIYDFKIQKTSPGEGYHVWHCEHGDKTARDRVGAFTVFLNTIQEGGETEFLYLKKRVPAVEGTMVIWPAGFTHCHRGNPPLDRDKYILTGWLELGV